MRNRIINHLIAFLVLMLITSCAPPDLQPTKAQEELGSSFTLVFRDGTCDYEGPARVLAGEVKLKIVIEEGNDEAMNGVAVVVATLQEGKTIEDLQAWPVTDKPPWATIVEFRELFPTPMEKEFPITLRKSPVYFVCFFPDSKIGAHGPLEVIPDETQQTGKPVETHAPRVAPTNSANPLPVVIDTDMALDDWLAILYLLNRTDVDVKGITVTGAGEAHCGPGVRNALKLVKLADKENIPIACGSEKPLVGDHTFPKEWRDFVDTFAGQDFPEAENPFKGGDAIALLQQIIGDSSKKVTLLTLGPLTNIAELLRAEGQIAEKIQMIYIMGGAVEVPGNVRYSVSGNNAAEYNIYVDPVAASEIVNSGMLVTLVPLDATNQVPLNIKFYERLEVDHPEEEAGFAYDVLATRLDSIRSGGYYFWDPLAAAILVDESLASIKEMSICVDTSEGNTSGATKNEPGCPMVRVAVSADQERFEYDFLETLNAP